METGNSWIVLDQQSQPCDSAGPNICELVYPGENLACSSLSSPGLGTQAPPPCLPHPLPPPQCKVRAAKNVFHWQAGQGSCSFSPSDCTVTSEGLFRSVLGCSQPQEEFLWPPMDLQPCFSHKNYSIQPVLEIANRLQTNKWQISTWGKTRMIKPRVFPLRCNMEF